MPCIRQRVVLSWLAFAGHKVVRTTELSGIEEEQDGGGRSGAQLIAACLDAAGLSIALIAAGQLVAASPGLHALLGHPPGTLDGVPWQELIAPSRQLTFDRLCQQVDRDPSHPLSYEILLTAADGSPIVMEVSHRALTLPDFSGQLLLITAPRRDRPLESAEYLSAICSRCGNVRDDHVEGRGHGKWLPFLDYVSTYELGRVTHSICPDCAVWLLNQ